MNQTENTTATTIIDTRFNTVELADKNLKWIKIDNSDRETYTEVSEFIREADKSEYEDLWNTEWDESYGEYEDSPEEIICFWDGHNHRKIALGDWTEREVLVNPAILKVIESNNAYNPDYALIEDTITHGDGSVSKDYYVFVSATSREADFHQITKISKIDPEDFTPEYLAEEGF